VLGRERTTRSAAQIISGTEIMTEGNGYVARNIRMVHMRRSEAQVYGREPRNTQNTRKRGGMGCATD
jgi:hypothetical protein